MVHLNPMMINDFTKITHIDRKLKQGIFYGFSVIKTSQ